MGKRERVMIACVTTETYRISEAAKYFDVDRIHLIHYVNDDNPKNWFFRSFYDRTVQLIEDSIPSIQIIECSSKVFYFDNMLKEIERIVEAENANEVQPTIYINVSAGSPEYISAATMISMMHENTEPVSVGAAEYLHNDDNDLRSIYFDGDNPVGLIRSIREPKIMPQFRLQAPNRSLVIGLRILDDHIRNGKSTTAKSVIDDLKKANVWDRTSAANDQVYYNRDFIDKWLANGWVVRHPNIRKRLVITDFGNFVLNTFYTNN